MVPNHNLHNNTNKIDNDYLELLKVIKEGIDDVTIAENIETSLGLWFLRRGLLVSLSSFLLGVAVPIMFTAPPAWFSTWVPSILAFILVVGAGLFGYLVGAKFLKNKYNFWIFALSIFGGGLALLAPALSTYSNQSFSIILVVMSLCITISILAITTFEKDSIINNLIDVRKKFDQLRKIISEEVVKARSTKYERILQELSPAVCKADSNPIASLTQLANMQRELAHLELLAIAGHRHRFDFEPIYVEPTARMFAEIADSPLVVLLGDLGFLSSDSGVEHLIDLVNHPSGNLQRVLIFFGSRSMKNKQGALSGEVFYELLNKLKKKLDGCTVESVTKIKETLSFHGVDQKQFTGFGFVVLGEKRNHGESLIIKKAYAFIPYNNADPEGTSPPWEKQPFVLSWPDGDYYALLHYIEALMKEPKDVLDQKVENLKNPQTVFLNIMDEMIIANNSE